MSYPKNGQIDPTAICVANNDNILGILNIEDKTSWPHSYHKVVVPKDPIERQKPKFP